MKRMLMSGLFLAILNANHDLYGEDKVILGVNVGYWTSGYVNAGFVGGYHYFFPAKWQFAGFRHGIRGIGSMNYVYAGKNGVSLSGMVDWSVDFNITDPIVWGSFVGLGIELIGANKIGLYPSGNIGGAITIDNTHRLELSVGYPRAVNIKYLYLF